MQTSSRLYHCLLCHAQVIICSHCDRGHRYCTGGCASTARQTSLARASKKYQGTRVGRFNNAARQQRYRLHQKQKVTHQSIQLASSNVVLKTSQTRRKTVFPEPTLDPVMVCHLCGDVCNPFLRHHFLRGRAFRDRLRY